MKISASLQGSNKTTSLQVVSDGLIIINGEETNLIPIPRSGQANVASPIVGTITKKASGECILTVLMHYDPRNTEWDGQELQEITVRDFTATDPVNLTIMDFVVPPAGGGPPPLSGGGGGPPEVAPSNVGLTSPGGPR